MFFFLTTTTISHTLAILRAASIFAGWTWWTWSWWTWFWWAWSRWTWTTSTAFMILTGMISTAAAVTAASTATSWTVGVLTGTASAIGITATPLIY